MDDRPQRTSRRISQSMERLSATEFIMDFLEALTVDRKYKYGIDQF